LATLAVLWDDGSVAAAAAAVAAAAAAAAGLSFRALSSFAKQ